MIQADFLTSTNREDILHTSEWNLSLLRGIVPSFLAAVDHFLQDPRLEFSWFRFIPRHVQEPFVFVADTILAQLKKKPIIRSADGLLYPPTTFVILPKRYRDQKRVPIIPERFLGSRGMYLPETYNIVQDSSFFSILGIREFNDEDFVASLALMGREVETREEDWHEQVARVLQQVQRLKKSNRGGVLNLPIHSKILSLRLLPLDSGSWLQATFSRDCVFDPKKAQIPADLGLKVLSSQIQPGTDRYRFLESIGVRQADPQLIAQKILGSTQSLSPASLVNHAYFIFQHRYSLPGSSIFKLRIASHRGIPCSSKDLYWDLPELRQIMPPVINYVHPAYLAVCSDSERDDWLRWLTTTFEFHKVPRVIDGKPSPELLAMSHSMPTEGFLRVLERYWREWRFSTVGMTQLSAIAMTCNDGAIHPLKSTALHRSTLATFPLLHFLPIEGADDPKWDFLDFLGVTVRPNAAMYLKALMELQSTGCMDVDQVIPIYKQLDARFGEDPESIR